MPVIKGKKAKSKKAKKPKVVPDPDEKFKQTLDTEMYVPKRTRERNDDELSQRVNSVFNLYTSEETQSDPNVVPMIKIAPIVRSLGLCPTNDQLKLISTMAAKGDNGAAYVERKVLEAVLLDILRTRILNYNPQVLSAPHPNFPERFSSVVYTAEEKHIAATFDSLWKTCGSCVTTSEGGDLRYIDAKELQKVALDSPELITGENEFTQQEIEDFLLTFTSSDSNVIREDTFLLLMLDVK
ncbi:hypothetical protein AGDE_12288 [Angomonas deanei]|uniref:Uncharacterized protein n=1 Tax=Angomonas deanei TaxID=59799 RepID=A0A7G2CS79_9TRYP|nr:hypothetical protein AGDE_12288 [Angomonas deanei]CAD2222646.1 hypothetical protein, conserved [Angomonas deanei]|eukprot:EPY24555.1 hypothetical protein AGDE_12288 [Angomonas deanei]